MRLLRKKIERSKSIIKQMLSICPNPYLALSFGKDSLVMADLVREQYPDIPCLFKKSNESYLINDYERIIPFYLEEGFNLIIVDDDRLSYCDPNKLLNQSGYGTEGWQKKEFLGYDGVFIGLRIQESKRRKYTLLAKSNNVIGDKIMQYKSSFMKGMYRCCPMAYWTEFEVLHYLKSKSMPMLKRYESGPSQRTVSALFSQAIGMGEIEKIKMESVERYNELIKLIPEIKKIGK